MEFSLIIAFFVGIIILCIVTRILSLPMRILWKLIYNSIIGAICLWLVNAVLGLSIAINFFTALLAGILGIPGVLLIIVYYLIK
ncbi:pro-sigmaK processing inhibitor BofA family protein [Pectinatus cerevisiiphilus]|uniref:Inhibitor of the pro-sigma K processing machinery n=1 Tax=Pectinatus cerevisiiphilus TaxID=86956 RepID=A0A4R3K8Q7_9FIRM|nr:pro-sigmaK processing inhibitor BofA family protein [Pectinatus cerevisiiphilus]TCS79297.1 inhibitor of the pro-sigma K processing machinery [Pectinatus cerevisiiphilus]